VRSSSALPTVEVIQGGRVQIAEGDATKSGKDAQLDVALVVVGGGRRQIVAVGLAPLESALDEVGDRLGASALAPAVGDLGISRASSFLAARSLGAVWYSNRLAPVRGSRPA
jgi:hypothetical protein